MKKLLALAASLIMVLALVSCGSPTEEQPEEQIDYEIALVTDAGLVMDGGYSEVAWNAISDFGATQGVSHKYYKTAGASEEACRTAIDDAVAKGAKIVIADGYALENVIYEVQNEYKDVKFVLIDAEPINPETGKVKLAENTAAILFASEEAGYLAGYAAVENGFSQLGFIGDAEKNEVIDYGYGFLQGANDAAANKGTTVNVKYHYCDETNDSAAITEEASKWYGEGTEAIFVHGAHIDRPVIQAAELADGKVILCDTDKSGMSDTVVTSVVKNIGGAITDILNKYKADKFPGKETISYSAAEDAIWIDMETGNFISFTEGDYKDLIRSLSKKYVDVQNHSAGGIDTLSLFNVNLIEE